MSQVFPLSSLIKRSRQNLFLPYYHSIQGDHPLIHIKHLYQPKTTKEFIKDLDLLLKHYNPISLFELKDHILNSKPFQRPSFHLSFDDGLREVYEIAMPILQEKGIPSTIFLNSDFLDNKALFYRYKIGLIIENLKKNTNQKEFSISMLQSFRYHDIHKIDAIINELKIDIQTFLKIEKPYLTTDQVKTLIQKGFTIGAHSENHPHYMDLDLDEQLNQTKNSIDIIQEKFDLDYRIFSFPFTDFGVKDSFFQKVKKNRVAEITFSSAGIKNDILLNHLHRTQMEDSGKSGKSILKTEYLYYLLKSPFGKNTAKRK